MAKTPEVLLRELAGTECQCGRPKQCRKTLCYRCFSKLSLHTRYALYQRFGDGYEQAYQEAIEELENLREGGKGGQIDHV